MEKKLLKKMHKTSVSQRILETRRQTEQLKEELQNLIASGIKSTSTNAQPSFSQGALLESTNKVQIIRSYDPKHSQHTNKINATNDDKPEPKNQTEVVSPKKPKTYNVEETREYMKKQREKRLEELRLKKKEPALTAEIRREKLQELQKKSQKLVAKNVQAKRERSRSREPPIVRSRSVSREPKPLVRPRSVSREKSVNQPFLADQNVFKKKPELNAGQKPLLESRNPGKVKILSQGGVDKPPRPIRELNKKVPNPQNSREHLSGLKPHLQAPNQNLLYPPQPKYGLASQEATECVSFRPVSSESQPSETPCSPNTSKSNDHPKNNVLLPQNMMEQPCSSERPKLNPINSLKSSKSYHEPENKKAQNKIIIHSNVTLRPNNNLVSGEPKLQYPEWLKDTLPESDPYNFINTVKRQLRYATNSLKPQSVDVGVQGNISENLSEGKSPKSSKRTDLISFISHKCLNLDQKTIEHIELNRAKGFSELKDGKTVSVASSYSGSESDTSKNIPSISSESGISLKRHAEYVNNSKFNDLKPTDEQNINLNTEKIDNVKLNQAMLLTTNSGHCGNSSEIDTQKSSSNISRLTVPTNNDILSTDIEKIKRNLFQNSDNYSSDFGTTDSEFSRSRNSIISGNCAKVSPNKTPTLLDTQKSFLDMPESGNKNHSTQLKISQNATLKNEGVILSDPDDVHKSEPSTILSYVDYRSMSVGFQPSELSGIETKTLIHKNFTENLLKKNGSQKPTSIELNKGKKKSISLNMDSIDSSQKTSIRSEGFRSLYSQFYPSTNPSDPETQKSSENLESQKNDGDSIQSEGTLGTFKKSQIDSVYKEKSSGEIDTEINVNESKKLHKEVFNKSKSEQNILDRMDQKNYSKSDPNLYSTKGKLSLAEPKLSLRISDKNKTNDQRRALMKNISIRSGDRTKGDSNNTNKIHLKFEAEIHLLNDFNESLRHFSKIEKEFESLRSKNDSDITTKKILHNRDTQTSIITKSTSQSKKSDNSRSQITSINYSRGTEMIASELGSDINSSVSKTNSEINRELSSVALEDTIKDFDSDKSSSVVHLSNLLVDGGSLRKTSEFDGDENENLNFKNFAGISLRMFDQLITDEDTRLENLKRILKIREQALLDRTRGELSWLEIQRKHLKETGNLQEASLIKKKQRGILLKHQQEKHEMQRLKQMQKEASIKRKTVLKEERNLIKSQLHTDKMLSKLKLNSYRERRHSGPLKVIQTHASESIRSETSFSKGKSTATEAEIKSITSRTCSVVNILSEVSDNLPSEIEPLQLSVRQDKNGNPVAVSRLKKTLLMREQALQQRRKVAEDLMQWHKKLLEEERVITDLETTAKKIISQIPCRNVEERLKVSKKDLNREAEGAPHTETSEQMSQVALERLQSSKDFSSSTPIQSIPSNSHEDQAISSEESPKDRSSSNYTMEFDVESVQQVLPEDVDVDTVDQSRISSISQLIDNFSKIKEEISSLSLIQGRKSLDLREDSAVKTANEDKDSLSGKTSSRVEDLSSVGEVEDEVGENIDISEKSSVSSHITSEIDVKGDEARVSEELVEIEQEKISKSISESSLIIVEEPDDIFVQYSEGAGAKESVEIEEIKEKSPSGKSVDDIVTNNVLIEELKDLSYLDGKLDIVEDPAVTHSAAASLEKESDVFSSNLEETSYKSPVSLSDAVVSEKESYKVVSEEISSEDVEEQIVKTISDVNEDQNEDQENNIDKALEGDSEEESIKSIVESKSPLPSEDKHELLQFTTSKNKDNASISEENQALDQGSEEKASGEKEDTYLSDDLKNSEWSSGKVLEDLAQESINPSEESGAFIDEEYDVKTSQDVEDPSSEQDASKNEIDEEMAKEFDEGYLASSSRKSDENKDSDQKAVSSVQEEPEIESNKSASKDNSSTSKQNEEIEDFVQSEAQSPLSNEEIASISLQHPSISSLSLTKEDISNLIEEKEHDSLSSASVLSVIETDRDKATPSTSLEAEQRKSSDNKTDEEKVASLSGKSKVSLQESASRVLSSISEESKKPEGDRIGSPIGDASTSFVKDRSLTVTGATESESFINEEIKSINSELSVPCEEDKSKSIKSDPLTSSDSNQSKSSTTEETKSEKSQKSPVDIKRRVLEILNEASPVFRGDKSPRMQDLCVMTYDLASPTISPDSGSPLDDRKPSSLGTEAEELLKKQLAIEQEIKLLTEQQKDQVPLIYVREIPNKPPPPYTPPSKIRLQKTVSLVPSTKEEIEEITKYSAKIIHKAYVTNNLSNISVSDNTLNLIAKNIDKPCYKYVFDLCKEIAQEHYNQFKKESGPSWMHVDKKNVLAPVRPLDVNGLEKLMNRKLSELFGFQKRETKRENTIIKWSRKKRDHVDEILVQEMQSEEVTWTTFDRDELIVKDRVTNEIMEMLLKETALVLARTVERKGEN